MTLRALLLLVLTLSTAASLSACVEHEDSGPSPWEMGEPESDAGTVAPDEFPSMNRLEVAYRSSIQPGFLEAGLSDLGDRDFFKFASHTAAVTVVSSEATPERVDLFIDGRLATGQRVDDREGPDFEVELPIETAHLEEGIHDIGFRAHFADGTEIFEEEEIRVLLNVTAMTQPRDGVFWFGTFEYGLGVYDTAGTPSDAIDDRAAGFGAVEVGLEPEWTLANVADSEPGPVGHAVATLAEDSAGRLWIGTLQGGLTVLDHNNTPFDRSDDAYAHFLPYVGREMAPMDGFQDYLDAFRANSVTAIIPEGRTGLWLGTFDGLVYFDHNGTLYDPSDDVWKHYDASGRYDDNISQLARDREGRIWIASFDLEADANDTNALTVLDPAGTPHLGYDDEWGRFATLAEELPNQVYTIAIDAQDLVWIGTTDGLFVLDHGGTPFDPEDDRYARRGTDHGLPDNDVAAVLPRGDGMVWVGSYDVCGGAGGGLSLLDLTHASELLADCGADPAAMVRCAALSPESDALIVTYTTEDGMLDSDISSISQLDDGSVLVGTFNLLSAPAVSELMEILGAKSAGSCARAEEGPAENPELRPQPDPQTTVMVGNDGLTVIDMGADIEDKSDDTIVNL